MIPPLDFQRPASADREVLMEAGPVAALVDEVDQFVDLPVRVVLGPDRAPALELGPYSLGDAEVERLIATWRRVAAGP